MPTFCILKGSSCVKIFSLGVLFDLLKEIQSTCMYFVIVRSLLKTVLEVKVSLDLNLYLVNFRQPVGVGPGKNVTVFR